MVRNLKSVAACAIIAIAISGCGGERVDQDTFYCESIASDGFTTRTCVQYSYILTGDTISGEEAVQLADDTCARDSLSTTSGCPGDKVALCSGDTYVTSVGSASVTLKATVSYYDNFFTTYSLADTRDSCRDGGGTFDKYRDPKTGGDGGGGDTTTGGDTTNDSCPSGQSCEALTNGESACFVGGTLIPFDAPACGDGFSCGVGQTPVSDDNGNCFCAEKC